MLAVFCGLAHTVPVTTRACPLLRIHASTLMQTHTFVFCRSLMLPKTNGVCEGGIVRHTSLAGDEPRL